MVAALTALTREQAVSQQLRAVGGMARQNRDVLERVPLATAVGEGEAVPMGTASFVLRAQAADTGGMYTLVESSRMNVGEGPGLHVHTREDETFIVLEGRYWFLVGDQELIGDQGTVVYCPRNAPHRFEVLSPRSRMLHMFTPGGIDDYFRRNYEALETERLDALADEFGIRFLD